jgi:peptide/nickel transport system ATP-binding protein
LTDVLRVRDLSVRYRDRDTVVQAIDGVSFTLHRGEALGVVGESGCGKSTLAKALLKLLPRNAEVTGGSVDLGGASVLEIADEALRRLRWTAMAYVTQSAMDSLNPVQRVVDHFVQTWRAHGRGRPARARARAEALLRSVGLDRRWLTSYPHELSGGMRQRVIIALALLFEPALLIADEPTTGLDVVVQRQLLDLLRKIRIEHETSVVLISHDMAVVAELCDSVAVMYAGRIVESGRTFDVLGSPRHPYTIGLKQAFPDIRDPRRALINIPGAPPSLDRPVPGCAFAPRCPLARAPCRVETPALRRVGSQEVACHFADETDSFRTRAGDPLLWQRAG